MGKLLCRFTFGAFNLWLFLALASAQEFTAIKGFNHEVIALIPSNPTEVGYSIISFQAGGTAVAFRENGDVVTLFPEFDPNNGRLVAMRNIFGERFDLPILPNGQIPINEELMLNTGDAFFSGRRLSTFNDTPLGYDPTGSGGYGYDKFLEDLGNPQKATLGLTLRMFLGRAFSPEFRENCDAALGGFRGHSPDECSSFGFSSRAAVYGNMATVATLPLGWTAAGIFLEEQARLDVPHSLIFH